MKNIVLKISFAVGIFLLSLNFNSHATTSSSELGEDGGGFVCPTGDKYKCAEKGGWTLYKGDGATPVT